MTTLETTVGTTSADTTTTKPASAPAEAAAQSTDTAALITEQQVLFASAAALAPAPAKHLHVAHELASAVRAMFVRPEKPHVRRHYPHRLAYLESSAMSREMDRL
jgi:hypothetical protein